MMLRFAETTQPLRRRERRPNHGEHSWICRLDRESVFMRMPDITSHGTYSSQRDAADALQAIALRPSTEGALK
jgi:hypothetical protein